MNAHYIVLALAGITIATGLLFGWLANRQPRP